MVGLSRARSLALCDLLLALCEVEAMMELACNPWAGAMVFSQSVRVARSCGAWLTEAGWGRGGQLVNFQVKLLLALSRRHFGCNFSPSRRLAEPSAKLTVSNPHWLFCS
jgi:hypothetical protein